ncbi:cyclase family protein [Halobacteria archaeon AArc-m2/3/4]|uniref:Cyclase family protein n=1 Tax=Natronoglomus mannanivorans TaxID=2979990 RepID=A0AAP2Z4H6_9EURY|nr:cyclase family protein [Halobacteria archaeon AArc-xg1-1]MCU4975232.1 cyclase family protein [Halobacteria archaeon AArc-m2/3/4]
MSPDPSPSSPPSASSNDSSPPTTHDLSHTLESGMPVYPGTASASLEPTASVESDGYRATRIDVDSHTGTHIDAPAHMLADGPTLEAYPLETFRFTARVLDCRPLAAREGIDSAAMLQAAADSETADAALEDVDLLVVRTGWEDYWGTDRYFDHPYLTEGAAEWLVSTDSHLGLDSLNPDPTPTDNAVDDEPAGYPAHHTLFADDRLILENLCGLEAVPDGDTFELHASPLAIGEADGSPVRAVAVLE